MEARQVDDAAHPGVGCRPAEGAGQLPVALDEASLAVHGVQKVVRDVHTLERLSQAGGGGGITLDHAHLLDPAAVGNLPGIPGEHGDVPAFVEQPRHQARTHVARRPRDQCVPRLGHRRSDVVVVPFCTSRGEAKTASGAALVITERSMVLMGLPS